MKGHGSEEQAMLNPGETEMSEEMNGGEMSFTVSFLFSQLHFLHSFTSNHYHPSEEQTCTIVMGIRACGSPHFAHSLAGQTRTRVRSK